MIISRKCRPQPALSKIVLSKSDLLRAGLFGSMVSESCYNISMAIFWVSRQRHLKNAALVWVLVGLMLGIRGMIWMLGDVNTHRWMAGLLPLGSAAWIVQGDVCVAQVGTEVG